GIPVEDAFDDVTACLIRKGSRVRIPPEAAAQHAARDQPAQLNKASEADREILK
ncbi:Hypothetical protein SMAX5B_002624, partial [Scophthalmus maximus]